jgi:hypothetical protein
VLWFQTGVCGGVWALWVLCLSQVLLLLDLHSLLCLLPAGSKPNYSNCSQVAALAADGVGRLPVMDGPHTVCAVGDQASRVLGVQP